MFKKKILLIVLVLLVSIFSYTQSGWEYANEIEKFIIPPTFPDKNYYLQDYIAKGEEATDYLSAINKAINDCGSNGGGSVIIPSGKYYLKGSIVFKSNVNLHLEEGSELIFSNDESDYLPVVFTRWEGTELFNYSPLVYASDVNNIAITGKGVLNGQGSKNFANWRSKQQQDQRRIRQMGRENIDVQKRIFGSGHYLRPAFVEPINSKNILIEDITIIDATFWVIHFINCENITVRGVKINSFNHNSDGCDPESSRYVLIENCHFRTGDDGVAIKSGRDNDGWRIGQPTENVIIRNCTFESPANGICIGSEISGGVRNVFIENIKMPRANSALYFKSNLDRGGYIENIWARNIKMDTVKTAAIRFEPDYKSESIENHPTRFQNFVIEDIECNYAKKAIDLKGFVDMPVSNVTLKNVNIIQTEKESTIENVENVNLENVIVNGKRIELKRY